MNSQLEKAIQEAMAECLDRTSSNQTSVQLTVPNSDSQQTTITTATVATTPITTKNTRNRVTRAATIQQRTKLIKIAPAPPNPNKKSYLI